MSKHISFPGETLSSLLLLGGQGTPEYRPLYTFALSLKDNTLFQVCEVSEYLVERKRLAKIVQKAHSQMYTDFLKLYTTQRGPMPKLDEDIPWMNEKHGRKADIHEDPRHSEFLFRIKYLLYIISLYEGLYLVAERMRKKLSHDSPWDAPSADGYTFDEFTANREMRLEDKHAVKLLVFFRQKEVVTEYYEKFGSVEKIQSICKEQFNEQRAMIAERGNRIKPIKWVKKDLFKPHVLHNLGDSILRDNATLCTMKVLSFGSELRKVYIPYAELCDMFNVPQECYIYNCDIHGISDKKVL